MEIITSGKFCILTPLTPKLDKRECGRVFSEIGEHSSFEIGLDLSFVEDCTVEFLEQLEKFPNLSAFNINSDIFTLLNIMGFDKNIKLYSTQEDFQNNKRRLLNRKFMIV